jgi:hypothetical protein
MVFQSKADGWVTDQHVYVYDLSNPAKPKFIRQWGLPGQQPTADVNTQQSCSSRTAPVVTAWIRSSIMPSSFPSRPPTIVQQGSGRLPHLVACLDESLQQVRIVPRHIDRVVAQPVAFGIAQPFLREVD